MFVTNVIKSKYIWLHNVKCCSVFFSGVCKTFNPGQDDVGSVEEVCSDVLTSGMKNPGQGSIPPTLDEHLLRQYILLCQKIQT
jgi:hypothetical protein